MQRYEIYINTTKVILLPTESLDDSILRDETHQVARYNGGVKHLLSYIDMFEKTNRIEEQVIHSFDFDKLVEDFFGIFKVVPAGGGLVVNEDNEILFIFRRGHWDLPKGKLEEGESIEEAAVREVEEETGIGDIEIVEKLADTRHVYRNRKERRCIKVSHWYTMKAPKQNLIPQTEEFIDFAEWKPLEEVINQPNIFGNIRGLLNTYKKTI